jgi:hypothetical protein
MALIAVCAVVHVAAPPRMIRVHLSFGMAGRTGKNRVIRRIRVAIDARSCGPSVPHRKPCVVECRSRPLGRAVACRACGREAGSRMPRIRCVLVFCRVTGITVSRGPHIFIVYVTEAALHTSVRAGQWERGRAVIEGCSRPRRCAVASRTQLRESRRRMVRICCAIIISQMAVGARLTKTCVDIVFMTRCTACGDVGARERE